MDKEPGPDFLQKFKAAFTPEAVRKIHEALVDTWPRNMAIESVLQSSRTDVSGLYVGEYRPELLVRGITRHSLYADKMLLVDPFVYPYSVRDQYNPILHPEKFRTQTIRNLAIWIPFFPWIQAGFIEFIRTPADFDPKLNWDSLNRQKEKFEKNVELKALLQEMADKQVEEFTEREGQRMLVLMAPDPYLRQTFRELHLGSGAFDEDAFIAHIHELRKRDPYYLEPYETDGKRSGEFFIQTSGASYDIAKLTASITGSYLVTDLVTRWKEIELDREQNTTGADEWSALAKAFQNIDLKYLNNLKFDHALALREEGRLNNLRVFLRRVWSAACSDNPFGVENVRNLADELEARVTEASEEWKQIDRDLIKWAGAEAAGGLIGAEAMIASGHAGFFASAIAVAGASTLLATYLRRKGFRDKFPAAFFMNLGK